MLMRHFTRAALSVSVLLAVPALGCGGGVVSEQVASAESATSRAPVAQSTHGLVKVTGDALGDVALTVAQRTQIEKLAADTEARHADARAAAKELWLALAAQVEAGRVDRAALQPRIDALGAALAKAQPEDRSSFEQLHTILTADQRVAFVDALEARIGARKTEVRGRHPLKQWADDLKLSDDQKAQIKSALKGRFHGGHESSEGPPWSGQRGAKVLAAFKQDRFVMDEVAPPRDVTAAMSRLGDHVLGLAEIVAPLLTPDQRAFAAAKLRERASANEEVP